MNGPKVILKGTGVVTSNPANRYCVLAVQHLGVRPDDHKYKSSVTWVRTHLFAKLMERADFPQETRREFVHDVLERFGINPHEESPEKQWLRRHLREVFAYYKRTTVEGL